MKIGAQKLLLAITSLCLLMPLGGCGGSANIGDTNSNRRSDPPPSLAIGQQNYKATAVVDGPVANLQYSSASISGTTDAAGSMQHVRGETVSFQLGSIFLGSTEGKNTITPYDLVYSADPIVNTRAQIQTLQLLHSLDNDGDPSNGIVLSETTVLLLDALRTQSTLGSENFLSDPALQTALFSLTNRSDWVTTEEALAHLGSQHKLHVDL